MSFDASAILQDLPPSAQEWVESEDDSKVEQQSGVRGNELGLQLLHAAPSLLADDGVRCEIEKGEDPSPSSSTCGGPSCFSFSKQEEINSDGPYQFPPSGLISVEFQDPSVVQSDVIEQKESCTYIPQNLDTEADQKGGFTCQTCNKVLSSKGSLQRHCTLYQHEFGSPYTLCTSCGVRFKFKATFDAHVCNKELNYKCHVCSQVFRFQGGLSCHMKIHTRGMNFECNLCSEAFGTSKKLQAHLRRHADLEVCCLICSKKFPNQRELNIHQRSHSEIRPFPCQACEKCFKSRGELNSHLKVHSEVREFKCDFCKKGFKFAGDLRVHRRTHTGDRPFECPDCSKTFKSKSEVTNHLRYHSDARPYKCHICNNSYKEWFKIYIFFKLLNVVI